MAMMVSECMPEADAFNVQDDGPLQSGLKIPVAKMPYYPMMRGSSARNVFETICGFIFELMKKIKLSVVLTDSQFWAPALVLILGLLLLIYLR